MAAKYFKPEQMCDLFRIVMPAYSYKDKITFYIIGPIFMNPKVYAKLRETFYPEILRMIKSGELSFLFDLGDEE